MSDRSSLSQPARRWARRASGGSRPVATGAPLPVSAWYAAVASKGSARDWLPPLANLIISNVPGVRTQLCFAGAKIISHYRA
jgi:hypothetical protein